MLLRFLSTLPDAFTRLPKKCAKIYSCGGFNTPTLASGLLIQNFAQKGMVNASMCGAFARFVVLLHIF